MFGFAEEDEEMTMEGWVVLARETMRKFVAEAQVLGLVEVPFVERYGSQKVACVFMNMSQGPPFCCRIFLDALSSSSSALLILTPSLRFFKLP